MISIDLELKKRNQMAKCLQLLLANEFVLYTKTLHFHWNIVGHNFGPLHKLFNDQYEQLQDIVDSVAERIRALDIKTHATLKEFLEQTTLKEEINSFPSDMEMLKKLTVDHETIICQIRQGIEESTNANDMGTNNFLCNLIEQHEKIAWMLRAHLE